MEIPYYHIDAFTSSPFKGNPAGVCLLDKWPTDLLLQRIAAENNLPETAFLVPVGNHYALRWFTPTVEVDLCGHATLAAAFVLSQVHQNLPAQIRFETRSGTLTVAKKDDLFLMDFPARPAAPCPLPPGLVSGLGATPKAVYKARDILAVFDTEEQVVSLTPNFAELARLDCFGIIVTAPGRKVDFVSRFFAPRAGIPEDPVTGSSHCTLIPYWAEAMGKSHLVASQLSRRGGELICEYKRERVRIGGRAALYHAAAIQLNGTD